MVISAILCDPQSKALWLKASELNNKFSLLNVALNFSKTYEIIRSWVGYHGGFFLWTSVCACISQLCNTCFISTFICNIALRILHMDHTYTIKSFSWYSFKLCTHTKKLSLRISCPGFCNMHPNESYKEIKKTTWGWKDGGISTRQEASWFLKIHSCFCVNWHTFLGCR